MPYTSISVSELPQTLNSGDQLVLTDESTGNTVSVGVQTGQAGTFVITTASFTLSATTTPGGFTVGTTIVQDTTYLGDVLFLDSEIPTPGVLNVEVQGGTQP
jgi:hypothetical protein